MTQSTDDRALKIKKLLAQAEDPACTTEESEAFTAKATELMVKWGIEEAMLNDLDRAVQEPIVSRSFRADCPKSYSHEYSIIGYNVAEVLGCKGILTKSRDNSVHVTVIGFASDVQNAATIFESAARQCTIHLATWYSRNVKPWHSGTDKFNLKKSFILGFAAGIKQKMQAARTQAVQDAGTGAELVLVTRSTQVERYMQDNFRTKKARPRQVIVDAYGSGRAAGQRANTGETSIGSARKALGQ